MSVDQAWLDQRLIQAKLATTVGYFAVKKEDVVSLRLRQEFTLWGHGQTTTDRTQSTVQFVVDPALVVDEEGYWLRQLDGVQLITAVTNKGLLYGFYGWVQRLVQGRSCIDFRTAPTQPLRMIDHPDQVDGSIERGYAGASIFFGGWDKVTNDDPGSFEVAPVSGDPFRHDHARLVAYARLMASIGINAIAINNSNVRDVGIALIIAPYLDGVAEIAAIFTSFGIKTFLAINWKAPELLGHCEDSDPLDPQVQAFWAKRCAEIYDRIPDFGGFLVKADSEGEPGPYQYGRNHAQGANMLAAVLAPYGGRVIWRTFVYDSQQDWRDRKHDRAAASFENFAELDGQFAPNVALQIKFGPMDYQTSEPANPLFGQLKHTNQIVEFQLTAEYLGQQIDVNYVLPQWLAMIDHDTETAMGQIKYALSKAALKVAQMGFAGNSNVGLDRYWTGHPLAQANLYGFGRMAWHDDLSAEAILDEWLKLTFAHTKDAVRQQIYAIMVDSNQTYRHYCAPLGVGFMVTPHYHYGPNIDGYEFDRWGTYHYADRNGVGVDRTCATGSGYSGLYAPSLAAKYEMVATTPLDLMLFFHHVSYRTLVNGKSLIQTIYDDHFAGLQTALSYRRQWQGLAGLVDADLFATVDQRMAKQCANAREWCDQVNTFFYRLSGIADEHHRQIFE